MDKELNDIKFSINPTMDDDIVCIRRHRVRIPSLDKKRHSSRKWKKKRGLLKRQRKAAWKRFCKTMRDIMRAARNAAKACVHFGETFSIAFQSINTNLEKGDEE